jgi:N-acetylmuramoyl-L-alanine amidase
MMIAAVRRFVCLKWVILLALILCSTHSVVGQKIDSQTKTIVIDAGHGGKDPGTIVGLAKEKNIVLDIALKLGKLIKQSQKNIKVVYTRDGDYFIPLMDRPQIANKVNADLFISIHANYCSSPSINGTETYVLGLHRTEDNLNVAKKENSVILLEDDYTKRYEGFNPNLSESYIMFELMRDTYLDQSLRFASILQSNFKIQAQREDREVRQAGFLVLRETSMPSVLIETGYLSNKKENSYLLTDAGRSEIAQSIYKSLLSYLTKIDTNDHLSVQPEKENVIEKTPVQKTTSIKTPVQTKPQVAISKENAGKTAEKRTGYEKQNDIKDSVKEDRTPDNKTTYAIQIGAFSRKINPDSKAFKGISPLKLMIIQGKYKYFCYESDSFQVTKSHFSTVAKSFPDAFIVSISNNQTKILFDSHGKR